MSKKTSPINNPADGRAQISPDKGNFDSPPQALSNSYKKVGNDDSMAKPLVNEGNAAYSRSLGVVVVPIVKVLGMAFPLETITVCSRE